MSTYNPYISKSKYLSGLQCHKLLWHQYNAKDKIPPFDAATQAIFDQGHLVGEYAKKLYPEGIEVAKGVYDITSVVKQTAEAVKHRKPLFEAGFTFNNAFARVDILNPVGKSEWDIIEVKSSTEVKEENINDLAIQHYIYQGAGLSIRNCHILHINNEYVRQGEIEPKKLFTIVDVTSEVNKLVPSVESNLQTMASVIQQKKFPDIKIGPHCNAPYECPLHEMCWKFLPQDNVFNLYWSGQKSFELINRGITRIIDIPDDIPLNDKQEIQRNTLRTGKPHVDTEQIKAFLSTIEYPLYFLDFETFMTAIPLFDNTRPYQQIPFQYSLHVARSENSKHEHYSFLSNGSKDPRPEILDRLQKELEESGSIIAYNASFEKSRIKESCELYSEFSSWYKKIEQRIVDLLVPFRSFFYYHPAQNGSASIKKVLPALTGQSYEGMEIAEGGTASIEYLRVTFNKVNENERRKIRKQLEEYCKMDTLAMIEIINSLNKL